MYQVKFYSGDYRERQEAANADRCVGYVEHHFNSAASPGANYAVVIVGSNASMTSKNWGRWYARSVAAEFGVPVGGDGGIMVGGYDGRGDFNLRFTDMPAVLLEPLFASNPRHVEWIRSDAGQDRLAALLAESIQRFFPAGGLVGFSIGHKGKRSRPNDRGAAVVGGGWEADYAEKVLKKAEARLVAAVAVSARREVVVRLAARELLRQPIDEDAVVTWDPARGVLNIEEG